MQQNSVAQAGFELVPEVTSMRTFDNNKSESFRDKNVSVYLHRSCLRDGCYTTNIKVNNDTCYCVSRSCNRGEAVSDHIGLSQSLYAYVFGSACLIGFTMYFNRVCLIKKFLKDSTLLSY